MTVKLDLRIEERVKSKSEAQTGVKHNLVFAAGAAFMFTMLAVLLLGGWKLYSLRREKAVALEEKAAVAQSSGVMDKEYSTLDAEASSLDASLSYMMEDIPAVEVLTTLDALLPNGVVIESVNISGGKVVFKGTALKEDAALQFVNNLSASSFAASVNVPDITNIKLKNLDARAFSVECALRPLREILARGSDSAPSSQDEGGSASGDAKSEAQSGGAKEGEAQ